MRSSVPVPVSRIIAIASGPSRAASRRPPRPAPAGAARSAIAASVVAASPVAASPVAASLVAASLVAAFLALAGCSTVDSVASRVGFDSGIPVGSPGYVKGFLGGVAFDEPRAALVAREVLSSGGNAADAAVAGAMMLSVTLPSRGGLGGGGACLAYDPEVTGPGRGQPEAILFVPPAGSGRGERPAAVPMLARGMFVLSARYGRRPFEGLAAYAEQSARLGQPVSRAFARDLEVVAGPLAGDPVARSIFLQPNGQPLAEGMPLVQPDLGATLAQLRTSGVGDLYTGALGRKFADAATLAGGAIAFTDLRGSVPKVAPPLVTQAAKHDEVAFLPPPADGGLAADAAFRSLVADPTDLAAARQRGLAVAAAWRASGGDPETLLAAQVPAGTLTRLPASTSFVTLDRDGRTVACALTMNNLFGTGRVAPGTGILLAASPAWLPPALLTAAVAWNDNIHAFRAAVGASGQEGAPLAAAVGIDQALAGPGAVATMSQLSSQGSALEQPTYAPFAPSEVMPHPVPDPGRANAIGCSGYLPGAEGTCTWATDPRGAGLAMGSN